MASETRSGSSNVHGGAGGLWRKATRALGLHLCVSAPRADGGGGCGGDAGGGLRPVVPAASRRSVSVAASVATPPPAALSPISANHGALIPTMPSRSSDGLQVSESGSSSSEKTCAICLGAMKVGHGHALFTAECSHAFHFHCIASNVKHGNYICPVCRAKWKEIPFQGSSVLPHGSARVSPVNLPQEDDQTTILRRLPQVEVNSQHDQFTSYVHPSEPITFNDDESLDLVPEMMVGPQPGRAKMLEIQICPEFKAIPQLVSMDNFNVLIHLKAPHSGMRQGPSRNLGASSTGPQNPRAPVDLVTLLDVSASMAGTKLALLKRAMGFLIQNLGPSDRLSVIAFSSAARRLFHLRRMSDSGRQQALQAVNSLVSSGGTNIAEGLRKCAKVIDERKLKNPICSIILLSDGRDTHTLCDVNGGGGGGSPPDYKLLVPSSILGATTHRTPVHTFGFGSDHDSTSMHAISQLSGGTFSFIESEVAIQDAFAQCIGGLLSVVVQQMRVLMIAHPDIQIAPIKSGSYSNQLADDGRSGLINVGDLYADEERNFLVSLSIPPASEEIVQLKVRCDYVDPVSNETITLTDRLRIQRPSFVRSQTPSIEVDRERNRIQTAEAMLDAKAAADRGSLSEAVSILEDRRRILSESLVARSGDRLCLSLDAELKEMQERMASRQAYEASGRAYVLSGLSSHSWQRATARGDSTSSASLVHAYQTPLMVDMLQRSQELAPCTHGFLSPVTRPSVMLFPPQMQPR